jgi:hypothetical protein
MSQRASGREEFTTVRIANLSGRLVLVTADGTGAVDVERASDGRFGPDAQPVYDRWVEFAGSSRFLMNRGARAGNRGCDPETLRARGPAGMGVA